jgi:3-oxoacyl-[acyl-carrier protein] reductase
MSRLDGKVALITGGSRGIGAGIARKLAGDGADIAITYARSSERALATVNSIIAEGRRAIAIEADNADPAKVEAAVRQTVKELGRIDILVNNVGIFLVGSIDAVSLEAFDQTFSINVRSAFLASKIAASYMGNGGRIISIGSNFAERIPAPGLSLYAASKAALVGLTKGMARDLGTRGITVNIVQPGSTNTDMNPANGPNSPQQIGRMAIPRFGEVTDIAGLVAWLASSESQFVTGAAMTIDGGASV